MRYHDNKICPDERTYGRTARSMPSPSFQAAVESGLKATCMNYIISIEAQYWDGSRQ